MGIIKYQRQAALWIDKNQNGYFETEERLLFYLGENKNNLTIDSIDLSEEITASLFIMR